MSTHKASKILSAGKLTLKPGRAAVVFKMILYLPPEEMLIVQEAIGKMLPGDLTRISVGNHQGKAVAAICRVWLKGQAK